MRLGYWAAAFALGLLLMEAFMRLFDPFGISYFWEMRRYENARVYGKPYDYSHAPGSMGKLQGVDVFINNLGMRSPEFEAGKPAGVRRVLILGDSIVFGWGVEQDQIVAAQLQRLADSRPGERWEVAGAGAVSWNARTEFEFLREEGDRIDADDIVLILTPNDAIPHESGRTDVARDSLLSDMDRNESRRPLPGIRTIVEKSYLVATIYFLTRTRVLADERPQPFCEEGSATARDAALALQGMAAYARDHGAVLIPYVFDGPETTCSDLFDRTLAGQGVRVRRFPKSLNERAYHNSVIDPHPNAAGHRLMAQTIMDDLRQQETPR